MSNILNTKIITDKVIERFDLDQSYTKLIDGDSKGLIAMLEDLVENHLPTFKHYISEYIYKHHQDLSEQYSDYNRIPEDTIWEYIKNDFKNHGLEDRGDLYSETISLDEKRDLFNVSGITIDSNRLKTQTLKNVRQDIFLFAFGLGMGTEDVSRMLCNVLLTYDFNPKDIEKLYTIGV